MVSYIISFIIISFSLLNNSYALGGRKILKSKYEYINVDIISFLSTECKPSVQGYRSRPSSSLKLRHRYGHCSNSSEKNDSNKPSVAEILARDQSRVTSIQNRRAFNKNAVLDDLGDSKTTVPVNSGEPYGSGNYVVTVGLGTPANDVTLVIDTGSSLTWTQCQPCTGHCYTQTDSIFDPSSSTSYSNATCDSTPCSQLSNSIYYTQSCSLESTCLYSAKYGDKSNTSGNLGNERLTLTPNDVFDNFYFGCGEGNYGLFDTTAGILGLGLDYFSLISQTASKYDKYFSYCLSTKSGSNGHLTLGNDNSAPSNLVFTPLTNDPTGQNYIVNIIAISVGGSQLAIDPSVFQAGKNIIDSGTVITRLPPTAYIALRDAFKQGMSQYPLVPGDALFDTCYDLSNSATQQIPAISFIFKGNVNVDLGINQIMLNINGSIGCLAFAANGDDTEILIFGNTQQQTLDVVYDVAGSRLGFATGGCS